MGPNEFNLSWPVDDQFNKLQIPQKEHLNNVFNQSPCHIGQETSRHQFNTSGANKYTGLQGKKQDIKYTIYPSLSEK